jgi:hypothetical protein
MGADPDSEAAEPEVQADGMSSVHVSTSAISIYNIGVDPESVQTKEPLSHHSAPSEFALLLQLAFPDPGISRGQFRRLFVRCQECDIYMTKGSFSYHRCHGDDS